MCERLRNSMEGFRNETSHWQFLNSFFKPSVTRFFISWFALAPVAVNAIQKLPNPLPITVGEAVYSITLNLPFRWEILWWASLVYAIAFVMHLIFCPGFIKRYPSYSAYIERGHSPRWLVWEVFRAWNSIPQKARQKLFKRLSDKKYASPEKTQLLPYAEPYVSDAGTEWAFIHEGETYVLRVSEELSSARQKDLFWEVLGRHGGSRSMRRYLIWVLLLSSAILVLWVVIQNIRFVLEYLIN